MHLLTVSGSDPVNEFTELSTSETPEFAERTKFCLSSALLKSVGDSGQEQDDLAKRS